MFDQKKETVSTLDVSSKGNPELMDDGNVAIHTMQEDLDALSGIFPKKETASSFPIKTNVEIPGKKQAGPNEQYFNPFLDKQPPLSQEKQDKIADFASKNNVSDEKPISKEAIPIKNKNTGTVPIHSGSASRKVVWAVVALLVVITFSLGGYYYWMTRNASLVEDNIQEQPLENKNEEQPLVQEVPVEPIPKYLIGKPNYLSIDTENPSYEDFKNIVDKTAAELRELGISKPVEFIITDKDNAPMEFPIFAAIGKLSFSDELMKTLSESKPFSLLIVHDSGMPRLGLLFKTEDQLTLSNIMKKEEPKLVQELIPLFLQNISPPKEKVIFKNNTDKSVLISYFNINGSTLSTVDYSFGGGYLMIGTSKNSMLEIIDKVTSEKVQQ